MSTTQEEKRASSEEFEMESIVTGVGGLFAGLILGRPAVQRVFQVLWHRKIFACGEEHKLVIVVRPDLNMNAGKVAAQSAHVAIASYRKISAESPKLCKSWLNMGEPTIVLRCDKFGEQALMDYVQVAKSKGIVTSTVYDAGRTQVPSGTLTAVGIGPGPKSLINQVTGKLRPW